MTELSRETISSVENSTLSQIRDLDIDDVIAYLHTDLKKLPDYTSLYQRYHRQRWNAYELDFTQDLADWQNGMTQEERDAFTAVSAGFHHGERQVEVELPVFMLGGSEESKMFLASQIEDEARHMVFFDRFYREVVDLPGESMQELLDSSFGYISETFVGSFGLLAYLADDLRRDPEDPVRRVRYGTAYFLWIEGVLALTVMKVTLGFCRNRGLLPGYYTGFTASCRDEARHVQAGMRFLRDSVQEDPRLLLAVHDTLRAALTASATTSRRIPLEPLGWDLAGLQQEMMRQLWMKLSDVGISLPPDLDSMVSAIRTRS